MDRNTHQDSIRREFRPELTVSIQSSGQDYLQLRLHSIAQDSIPSRQDRINCNQPRHAGVLYRQSCRLKLGPQFRSARGVEGVVEEGLDLGRFGVKQFGQVFDLVAMAGEGWLQIVELS